MMRALLELNAFQATAVVTMLFLFAYAFAAVAAALLGRLLRAIDRLLTPPEFCDDPRRPFSPHHPAYVRRGNAWFRAPPLQDAPVVFLGWQDPCGTRTEPIELWNLTQDIPGHSAGSTVSRETLERAGYWVPIAPPLSPKET